jgi:flavin reductase (DIM6/NTAB) family NADH-FMN oxidoreductase RutF
VSFERVQAEGLSNRNAYRLMTDLVAPRPIAWLSTVSAAGQRNLAPYSYFQAVCSSPATVVVSLGRRSDGSPKDSLRNILDTRRFTVCHVSEPLSEAMNASSAAYEPGVDESEALGVEMSDAEGLFAPVVSQSLAAFSCVLQHAIPLGEGAGRSAGNAPSTTLVIARVESFYLKPGLLSRNEQGNFLPIDAGALQAVGRLGGLGYTTTQERFELDRPARPKSE